MARYSTNAVAADKNGEEASTEGNKNQTTLEKSENELKEEVAAMKVKRQ